MTTLMRQKLQEWKDERKKVMVRFDKNNYTEGKLIDFDEDTCLIDEGVDGTEEITVCSGWTRITGIDGE